MGLQAQPSGVLEEGVDCGGAAEFGGCAIVGVKGDGAAERLKRLKKGLGDCWRTSC